MDVFLSAAERKKQSSPAVAARPPQCVGHILHWSVFLGKGADAPRVRKSTCRRAAAVQPPAKPSPNILVPKEINPAACREPGTPLCLLHHGLALLSRWSGQTQVRCASGDLG